MIYGYIRVSTDKQTTENQRFEIQNFAKRNNIIVDEWIEEIISSTKSLKKRKLGNLIKNVQKGDLIIASELSRLGRNLLQIMGILNHLLSSNARVWTIKDNYKLGDDIPSKVLAFAFGLSAEIERKMISQRTKEALKRIRSEGKILGRPFGCKCTKSKLTDKTNNITRWLSKGYTKSSIAKKLNVNRGTLNKFIKKEKLFTI
jgi:DNA invertase Pin-like site-specific DNA recombinase